MYSGTGQEQPPTYQPPRQRVQFEFIGEAFQLFQKQLGAWAGASTLTVLLSSLLAGPLYGYWVYQVIKNPELSQNTVLTGLLTGVVTLVSVLLHAGLQHMALKQLRGETLSATSFAGAFSRIGSLTVVALVMGAIATLFGMLPGFLALFLMVPHVLITTLLVLAIPLILDQNLKPITALKESVRVMRQEFWISLAFVLLSSLASAVGFFACGIGVIFSLPLYPLCLMLLYRAFYPERFPTPQTPEVR